MTTDPSIPKHIAIIMDGNRRWARTHALEVLQGHSYVVDHCIEPLVDRCIELGIPYLTLWAFSTENWGRDKSEVQGLMQIFRRAFEKKVADLHAKGVRLEIIGNIDAFPEDIAKKAKEWVEVSKQNTKITVNFALNYGGRDEILRAVNAIVDDHSGKDSAPVTAAEFESHLYTAGMPDPDLFIRPGGEKRFSGLMPWQMTYTELYFTDVLMPDFTPEQLDIAIAEYAVRQRRFGK